MKILILDNYDSFTHNLYHYVQQFTDDVTVKKNDEIVLLEIEKYDKIIISPGPGLPDEHENLKVIIKRYASTKSILGVCLGHQAITECFGGKLKNLKEVLHGISTEIFFLEEDVIFKTLPKKIKVGHYHSWVIDEKTFPSCFEITAKNEDGIIMAIRHKEYDVKGVQFHPESVLTEHGLLMIKNWVFS